MPKLLKANKEKLNKEKHPENISEYYKTCKNDWLISSKAQKVLLSSSKFTNFVKKIIKTHNIIIKKFTKEY